MLHLHEQTFFVEMFPTYQTFHTYRHVLQTLYSILVIATEQCCLFL